MKKLIICASLIMAFSFTAVAQEVKSEIETIDNRKTVVMTVNADRFNDLKNFDWRSNLERVFRDVNDDAIVGIRVNIRDKQLTSDSTTLPNVMSLYAQDYAKNKEELLRKAVRMVAGFVDDDQQGHNKK